jgi:hypothetical protein
VSIQPSQSPAKGRQTVTLNDATQRRLTALSQWTLHSINAARELDRLFSSGGLHQINLGFRMYTVGSKTYVGLTTDEQNARLQAKSGSATTFDAELIKLIALLDQNACAAITALIAGLTPPHGQRPKLAATSTGGGGVNYPPLGCCQIGTQTVKGVSQSCCCCALQGDQWDSTNQCAFPAASCSTFSCPPLGVMRRSPKRARPR